MIYLLTFADGNLFEKTRNLFDDTLNILEVDKHIKYNKNKIINTNFYKKNIDIFKYKVGFGLYIWKPYIILQELTNIQYGDYIFYCDCSKYIIEGFKHSIKPLIEYMEQNKIDIIPGILQPKINNITSSDICINRIHHDYNFNIDNFKNSYQYTAGHIVIKKTNNSIHFIQEWLKYCQIWECIKKIKTPFGFNNCDMSIFNILLFIYGIKNPTPPLTKEIARDHNIFLKSFNSN